MVNEPEVIRAPPKPRRRPGELGASCSTTRGMHALSLPESPGSVSTVGAHHGERARAHQGTTEAQAPAGRVACVLWHNGGMHTHTPPQNPNQSRPQSICTAGAHHGERARGHQGSTEEAAGAAHLVPIEVAVEPAPAAWHGALTACRQGCGDRVGRAVHRHLAVLGRGADRHLLAGRRLEGHHVGSRLVGAGNLRKDKWRTGQATDARSAMWRARRLSATREPIVLRAAGRRRRRLTWKVASTQPLVDASVVMSM